MPRLHRRDRMLIDQLHLARALEHKRKLIEPGNAALQHHAVHQEDRHGLMLSRRGLQEQVLEHRLFPVTPFSAWHEFQVIRGLSRHDGRDGMLVDQLGAAVAAEQQREWVVPGYDPLQLDPFDQENGHRGLRPADRIEELILQAQHFVSHFYDNSSSRLSPSPSALSFRCRAERSMPMNEAVREMLPEKRRIWILRYSRSKLSRASRSGEPMIAIDAPPSPAEPWESMISCGSRSTSMQPTRSPGVRMSVRSMMFLSWRTLPGQSCA